MILQVFITMAAGWINRHLLCQRKKVCLAYFTYDLF